MMFLLVAYTMDWKRKFKLWNCRGITWIEKYKLDLNIAYREDLSVLKTALQKEWQEIGSGSKSRKV